MENRTNDYRALARRLDAFDARLVAERRDLERALAGLRDCALTNPRLTPQERDDALAAVDRVRDFAQRSPRQTNSRVRNRQTTRKGATE